MPQEIRTPTIPKAVLDYMEALWPERSAELYDDSYGQLMFRGGARSVVRKLRDDFERQNTNILNS